VRPLRRGDHPEIAAWVERNVAPETTEYRALDPEGELAWGAFDGSRLVGVARAAVRLPREWVLGGIYVEPSSRGRSLGEELVSAAVLAAESAGASIGLYVRDDRAPARRLYERLGFRTVGRRLWLDLGAGLEP
jgi:ribosomal protein S18 acetylase RimI-like enzyme